MKAFPHKFYLLEEQEANKIADSGDKKRDEVHHDEENYI